MSFSDAERLADSRRFAAARAAIDELLAEERRTNRALQVRLRCCCGLSRCDMGKEIAALLAEGEVKDPIAAAGFYHLLAVAHRQEGNLADAREVASRAVGAWKPARIATLQDNRLGGLF